MKHSNSFFGILVFFISINCSSIKNRTKEYFLHDICGNKIKLNLIDNQRCSLKFLNSKSQKDSISLIYSAQKVVLYGYVKNKKEFNKKKVRFSRIVFYPNEEMLKTKFNFIKFDTIYIDERNNVTNTLKSCYK